MYKNIFIILLILVTVLLLYLLTNYYKDKSFIEEILKEWKIQTNNGYIKIDKNYRYNGDYYLSFKTFHDNNCHIHFIINNNEDYLCYVLKKYNNNSGLYKINRNKTSDIVKEMIKNYNNFLVNI